MTNVLTIAGTDPSGAAGLQADLQVIRDHDLHGLSVVTAVLAQNTSDVDSWQAVEPKLVRDQLNAVLTDIPVSAVKIGMIPTPGVAEMVAEALRGRRIPVVLDPVLASGDGKAALVREGTLEVLTELLVPHVTLTTPNLLEANALLVEDHDPRLSWDELLEKASRLRDRGANAILLKGGHVHAEKGVSTIRDAFASASETMLLKSHPRIAADVRGTGCQLSSAIACNLAVGEELVDAIEAARDYLASLLQQRSRRLGKGRWVVVRGDR